MNESNNIKMFHEIPKGWLTDKKYYIQMNNQEKYLLRTASIKAYKRKRMEFENMEEIFLLDIPMSKPLDFTTGNDEVYTLLSWAEGNDLEPILPMLTDEKQYELGFEAGEILKKMHSLPAPKETEEWKSSYNRKIDRNINNYLNCGLKYESDELFLDYIDKNRYLIKKRPLTFQHGDFHIGNMILSPEKELTIIDFNRWDYGDPWEEFNRIDFSAETSLLFATGQIDGYFSYEPPVEFFQLMALYICSNTLNALPWALGHSKKEVDTMRKKAAAVLEWYDNMQEVIPNWYKKEIGVKYGKK